jgi:hypothetical protein
MTEQHTTITIPMGNLTSLVRVVGHAAGKDNSIPSLQVLKFTAGDGDDLLPHFEHRTFSRRAVSGPSLSAVATDRYRMVWASSKCTIEPLVLGGPAEFMLEVGPLLSMVQRFPKQPTGRRRRSLDVVIVVTGEHVQFTVKGDEFEQTSTLPRVWFQFPNVEKVATYGMEKPQPEHYAVSPVFAADMFTAFQKVCRYREPVAVSSSGGNSPVRFSMPNGGQVAASGLLMPVSGG